MFEFWIEEELLFCRIFDALRSNDDMSGFSGALEQLLCSKPSERRKQLENQKGDISAADILKRWHEQTDFIKKQHIELDLTGANLAQLSAEASKEMHGFTMSRMFKPFEHVKKLAAQISLNLKVKDLIKQVELKSVWMPELLLEIKDHENLLNTNLPNISGVPPRLLAQMVVCQNALDRVPSHWLEKILRIPHSVGRIIPVTKTNPYSFPDSPEGLEFTSSQDRSGIKVIESGLVVHIQGCTAFGFPSPNVLAQPLETLFHSPELRSIWNILGKDVSGWKTAPELLANIGWLLARNSGNPGLSIPSPENPKALQPDSTSSKPQQEKTEGNLGVELLSFPNLGTDLKTAWQRFEGNLSQSNIVVKAVLLPFLNSLLNHYKQNLNQKDVINGWFVKLRQFLKKKGAFILPEDYSFGKTLEKPDTSVWDVIHRFHEQIPMGVSEIQKFGIGDAAKTEKPVVLISAGPYPVGLKDAIDGLNGGFPEVGSLVESLENLAAEKSNLEFASIRIFQEIYSGQWKGLLQSHPTQLKNFQEKYAIYLRRNFEIRMFDPMKSNQCPEDCFETVQNRGAVFGTIRKVIRPGLIDQDKRCRLKALVEMD